MKNLIKINLILLITIFFSNCKKENVDPVLPPNNVVIIPIDSTNNNIIDTTKSDTLQSVKDSLLYINLKNNGSNEYLKVVFHDTIYEFFTDKHTIFLNNNNSYGRGNSCFIPIGRADYIFINGIKKTALQFSKYPVYGIEFFLIMQGKIDEISLNKKYATHRGSSSYNTFNTTLVYGKGIYNTNMNGPNGAAYSGVRNIKTDDTTDNYNVITKIVDANELFEGKNKFTISGYTKMTIAENNVEPKVLYDNQSIEIFYNNLKLLYYKDNRIDIPGLGNPPNERCDYCW